jgi:small subunit ribosomal protein S17
MKTRGMRKSITGTVVSNKMEKTVVVTVERLVRHPVYQKYIQRKSKYLAHDEENQCQVGDRVLLQETRPLSKLKRFSVSKILEKTQV